MSVVEDDSSEICVATVVQLDVASPSRSFISSRTQTPSLTSIEPTPRYRRRERRTRPAATGGVQSEKFWLHVQKTKTQKIVHRMPLFAMLASIIIIGLFAYSGWSQVNHHDYCLVLDEEFQSLDPSIWRHDQQLDGFGTGSFEWTTDSSDNSFVQNGVLHIRPSLQTQTSTQQGTVLNLTESNTCTGFGDLACTAIVNSSVSSIINPVQSARLTTINSTAIRYGKVEVRAKAPVGQWLWPEISLLPRDSVYGQWPASGEIDIFSSWGNKKIPDYLPASNAMQSSLYFGPDGAWAKAKAISTKYALRNGAFSDDFHTFGLVWTDEKMYTYVDKILTNVLNYKTNTPDHFWTTGKFRVAKVNECLLWGNCNVNPWLNGTDIAPYDQNFYLSLSLKVGGLNGWFPDGGGKPWTNTMNHTTAMTNFNNAQNVWAPTWKTGASDFQIDSVKIWRQCSK